MPRPPVKKTRKLGRAKRQGELRAERDAKFYGIPSFFRHFFKGRGHKERCITAWEFVNEIKGKIPMGIAVIGMTVLVKRIIETTEEYGKIVTHLPPWGIPFKAILGIDTPWDWGEVGEVGGEGLFPDYMDWVIAFSLAYIIVNNAGELFRAFGATVQGLKPVVGLLLGAIT